MWHCVLVFYKYVRPPLPHSPQHYTDSKYIIVLKGFLLYFAAGSHLFKTSRICGYSHCEFQVNILLVNALLSPAELQPGKEIIKCILRVPAWVRALVCHADFSQTTTATDFLSINCPNEFPRPWKFFWVCGLRPKDKYVVYLLFHVLCHCQSSSYNANWIIATLTFFHGVSHFLSSKVFSIEVCYKICYP